MSKEKNAADEVGVWPARRKARLIMRPQMTSRYQGIGYKFAIQAGMMESTASMMIIKKSFD